MRVEDINSVTVAGGGTQGSQIASQIAYKGFAVTVWVRSEASVERARARFATIKEQYLSTLEAMKTDASAYCRGLADTPDLSAEQIDALVTQAEERLSAIKFETDWDARGAGPEVKFKGEDRVLHKLSRTCRSALSS